MRTHPSRFVLGPFILLLLLCVVLTKHCYGEHLFSEGEPILDTVSETTTCLPRFETLAKIFSRSVVNISVEGEGGTATNEQPSDNNELGNALRSVGSGFVVSKAGEIVTSNHVIEGASRIVVRFFDDREEYQARIVGRDPKTDLALLEVDPKSDIKPVFIGDSDKLEVGEWVLAIGNQFHLGQTVTAGIVSAKGRRVPAVHTGPYDSFIQTDASINPGSSGGPLFNTRGQVVGINTAIFTPGRANFGGTGFNIGIGFAVPINMARDIISQLKAKGKVTRGFLGVMIQRIDKDTSRALGLPQPEGALVSDVHENSPAARAGLRTRDVIVEFNNTTIIDHDQLPLMVAKIAVGQNVILKVNRKGEIKTLSVTIDELKEAIPVATSVRKSTNIERRPNKIGIVAEAVTDEASKNVNQRMVSGVFIFSVAAGSIAERAGVMAGDIIEELGDKVIKDLKEFEASVDKLQPEIPVLVLVRRKEGTRFLTMKMQ